MTKRRPLYSTGQTVIDFNAAPEPEPVPPPQEPPAPAANAVAEAASSPGFSIEPGWIDTADRTRTWNLLDTKGGKMAEICTKRDAQKLADIFNHLREGSRGRSR